VGEDWTGKLLVRGQEMSARRYKFRDLPNSLVSVVSNCVLCM
jgi:hypothetical protein